MITKYTNVMRKCYVHFESRSNNRDLKRALCEQQKYDTRLSLMWVKFLRHHNYRRYYKPNFHPMQLRLRFEILTMFVF